MQVITVLGYIAGGLVSVGIIWSKGILPISRFIRKMDSMYDRVDQLPEWCASVDESLKQLHPNGGQSLKDRVVQTHTMMTTHIADGHDHLRSDV
jgi:hypothetical protein